MSENSPEPIIPADGRLITIDILRGLSILWVVVFHLWGASALSVPFAPAPRTYYERFWDRLQDGDALAAFTALTDLLFRLGNNGVTVFMILSGVSLTISAMRGRGGLQLSRFYPTRLRRLMVPYWAAWALYIATMAALALYRVYADGGTFTLNFRWYGYIHQGDPHLLVAGLLLFPRALQADYLFAPAPALWFVTLLLQYYLLFPPLFYLLQRRNIFAFAGAMLLVSIASSYWLIWEYGSISARGYYWGGFFPFRFFEFGIGMAIGYAMIEYPHALRRISSSVLPVAALALAGIALHTTGSWIDDSSGYWNAWGYALITAGFAALVLAIVSCRPGALLTSPPARLMAWIGVISYTVLIVNESFRMVNFYMIIQGYQWTAAWWFFVVVLYVPVTVILAYPLAALLGLLPKQRKPASATGAHGIPAPLPTAP